MLTLVAALAFSGCFSKESVTEEEAMNEVNQIVSEVQEEIAAEAEAEMALDYVTGLSDNGFYDNVAALDLVELFDYTNIEVPAEVHTISDDILRSEIDTLLAYFITYEQVTDRSVADGDTVNIDYVGSVDGVEFDGGTTGGMGTDVTIGVTSYIDDFLEQLIGHVPGESFDIEVTFPEEYGVPDLNGKDAVFAITINYISEEIMPELTDAFVAENLSESNGWTNVDEMNAGVLEELQGMAIANYIQTDLFAETAVASVPASVMAYQQNAMANYYRSAAMEYGMTLEEFLVGYSGYTTLDEMYEVYSDQLIEMANFTLIIQAVAEDAGIEVTEEDLSAYFLKYNGNEDYSMIEDLYGIEYLKYSVLQDVVMDFLAGQAELL